MAVVALGLKELPLVFHVHQQAGVAANLVVPRLAGDDAPGRQQAGALGVKAHHGHRLANVLVVVVAHGGAPAVLGKAVQAKGGGLAAAALHVAGGHRVVQLNQVAGVGHILGNLIGKRRVGVGHVGGVARHRHHHDHGEQRVVVRLAGRGDALLFQQGVGQAPGVLLLVDAAGGADLKAGQRKGVALIALQQLLGGHVHLGGVDQHLPGDGAVLRLGHQLVGKGAGALQLLGVQAADFLEEVLGV